MQHLQSFAPQLIRAASISIIVLLASAIGFSQPEISGLAVYEQIKSFQLTSKADVSNLVLKRDRVTMTLNGTLYFSSPVLGKVTGAVFIGRGTIVIPAPPSDFERANLKRLLKADQVSSDFSNAILRFSDDTFELIGKTKQDGPVPAEAQRLASDIGPRVLRDTGANISSRLAISLLNREPE